MAGDVEMQDLPSSVLDDEKAVKQLKRQSRHREKVESGDHLAVIMEEGQPGFPRVTSTTNLPQVSSHGPFRLLEPELLQFAMDLWGAPACILFCHPADEPSNLLGDLGPTAARPGTPAPI
jgi:hypothetical protein